MILISPLSTHQIIIDEHKHAVLVIEDPSLFHRFIIDIHMQSEGIDKGFVLSDSWVPMDFNKSVVVITDLFTFGLNNKKASAALVKQLSAVAVSEKMFLETNKCMETISNWAYRLESEMPYSICHVPIEDSALLIKTIGFHFDDDVDLPEKICLLIKILATFLNIHLLVIPWLHDCVSSESLKWIYKTAEYEKMGLLLIESHMPERKQSSENLYIIDRDLCDL